MVELPYGRVPYRLAIQGRDVTVLEPSPPDGVETLAPGPSVSGASNHGAGIEAVTVLLDRALTNPIGRPPLAVSLHSGDRVTLVVSDATRQEPRAAFIEAVLRHAPPVRLTVAIATGTHGPANLGALHLPHFLDPARIVNHDGHDDRDLVDLGVTARGTPVRLHRSAIEADLVVATGCIRPHYFAGFGAGVKAIFPGLGHARGIRFNHRLKTHPMSRAGSLEYNPCRLDLEEAWHLLPTPSFLVNGVSGPDGSLPAVVAGDPIAAFRAGAAMCRPWFSVSAARAPVVIASDVLPITASLYQAAKIAAAVVDLVREGGTLIVVAACSDGIEPLEVVNEAIFRIGILPRLARGTNLVLVSDLPACDVSKTLLSYAPSVEQALEGTSGPILIIPRASQLIATAR